MENKKVYDMIGVGIGPFNLGMAALLDNKEEIEGIFFEESSSFNWHPGMLIEGADLQVPFLADLVTFADPTSKYSFINYLHKHNRLYTFYFFNRFDIPRREYNDYAQWVAGQLDNCRFNKRVVDVTDHVTTSSYYEVTVEDQQTKVLETYLAKHLVIGTGSSPSIPAEFEGFPQEDVLHTSAYQYCVDTFTEADKVLIAGSGQSAAEVFLDQLQRQTQRKPMLYWLTRSPGFFQLEAGKLGQEVFSPDYIDYFHKLSYETRQKELPHLTQLRNGIEEKTLHKIYDLLYHHTTQIRELPVLIQANVELKSIEKGKDGYHVSCYQLQEDMSFTITVDKIVLATGYQPHIPNWLHKFSDLIEWEDDAHFNVSRDYKLQFKEERSHHIFTLTNLEHSHGAGATNLALAVERNVTIINRIAGKPLYPEQRHTIFQTFSHDAHNDY
ncbi:SidA/IucD/PvdA family monooxygenase [Salipaludibacillus agaradhaerens]|uniref:L-lysine N6-monooxygenase MbtG n=1 Tax=Salipaludibacillus agaradhaerens TaxID=76935 RepID=A0A9Q4B2Y4_SALAG|nr:SidA/IucD/PvdA family monooxygenase [Salipaludibacillus agaradhaerens]MCR6097359.1 SidA/IucD/PvdA family monooxygenase [Salipaludibacillus agaradhaerens]MCR6113156.1 SidA/IucD/PvdA family monooxygenase [Salipaludibacillus agaradhaerens]